jgi:dethiobiotin synthetase
MCEEKMTKTYFITAIDTEVGKTVCTGILARFLLKQKVQVITQKIIQTGSDDIAEDILTHRKIMGINLLTDDLMKWTGPLMYPYPASPHLAAELANSHVDLEKWEQAYNKLKKKYEVILIEGVGGLYVPITRSYFLLDWLAERKFDTILVTSPRLGSINHTFLSMEALRRRDIPVRMLLYNYHFKKNDDISKDSLNLFRQHFAPVPVVEVPFGVHSGNELDRFLELNQDILSRLLLY